MILMITMLTTVWQVSMVNGLQQKISIYDPDESIVRCRAPFPKTSLLKCDINSIRNESQHVRNEGVFLNTIYECLTIQINNFRARMTRLALSRSHSLTKTFATDCYDYYASGMNVTGPYNVSSSPYGIRQKTVWCEMSVDGGGWMVVQARLYTSQIFFNRLWRDYKLGFGVIGVENWFGLEDLYTWTNAQPYNLRIDLVDAEGRKAYVKYDQFFIEGEDDGYKLHVNGYSGTAGNAFGEEQESKRENSYGMKFSTVDRDNDNSERNCADDLEGGWWYNACTQAKLNSPFVMSENYKVGVKWLTWTKRPLTEVTMMIRPSKNILKTVSPNFLSKT
ncbi:techylectin-5A-like [Portunus trituberculatus]|uniref:techylectin-5A-like n=1 Tax=Portunus trituberculatus TaxID=210409 RepID=UPI001E1CD259|nr:techylectin-5A-like [Portunus trituberculatus]